MKRIMYLLIGLLLVSLVRADTNVSIAIASIEDIHLIMNTLLIIKVLSQKI